jgi:hypothetical protein
VLGPIILEWVQDHGIADNCMGDSGAVSLANALIHNSSLTALELCGNGIADKGGVAIARLLLGR